MDTNRVVVIGSRAFPFKSIDSKMILVVDISFYDDREFILAIFGLDQLKNKLQDVVITNLDGSIIRGKFLINSCVVSGSTLTVSVLKVRDANNQ